MSGRAEDASDGHASGIDARHSGDVLLRVDGLKKHFPVNTGFINSLRWNRDGGAFPIELDDRSVKAVDGVSFELERGETLGVVGESGCGKSTLARTIVGLEEATAGSITFDGTDVTVLEDQESWFRRHCQMVFQDPQSSLNPRRKVGEIIADPLEAAGWEPEERRERVFDLLEDVGLKQEYYNRYPHEFSGGQRQRINLARALSVNPELVIADEPVSGLDMSVKAQILRLMQDLQDEYGLTYLFITHDLGVVRNVAERVAVMYLGDFVEMGPTADLFDRPHHPYTQSLLDAVPNPNPDLPSARATLAGAPPSPSNPPSGCKFHTRCPSFILPDWADEPTYETFRDLRTAVDQEELSVTPEAVFETYDLENVPSQVRSAVREAATAAAADEWESAREELAAFASPCEVDVPPLEELAEADHRSACHLDESARESFEW